MIAAGGWSSRNGKSWLLVLHGLALSAFGSICFSTTHRVSFAVFAALLTSFYSWRLVFLTFFVITATLLGQGLTLSPFIRGLKVGADWEGERERQQARAAMRHAALAAIDAAAGAGDVSPTLATVLRSEFSDGADGKETLRGVDELLLQIRRAAIDAERRALISLWRNNEIGDEVLHHREELLDYREAQLKG